MSNEEQRFRRLKRNADKIEKDVLQSEAEWKVMMRRLQDEFDCETIEDAEALLKQLKRREVSAKKKLSAAMDDFEDTWKELLEDEELDEDD